MAEQPAADSRAFSKTTARVLAMGGSTRADSATDRVLRVAADAAREAGADVTIISGRSLMLPIYDPESPDRDPAAVSFVDAARNADGLIVVSPGYHGGISGMVKNALDYFEDLREPHGEEGHRYLDGKAVGCVAVAAGWQAAVSTLQQLRQVVHALRGWPTPLGAAVNSESATLSPVDSNDPVVWQLNMVGRQVVEFARMRQAFTQGGR